MLSDHPELDIPAFPERDEEGGDSLPTYDDLAAQQGPNSRFGRWRQWIEKRAAERYADLTPEEWERRRARGWGEDVGGTEQVSDMASASVPPLHIRTDFSSSEIASTTISDSGTCAAPPLPAALVPEPLSPSRLRLYQFGSRFLPHTTAPIRCLLPILNDTLLLIGHDNGLSVLDMFPREWSDDGIIEKGPNDAEVRPIWEGEAVHQLTILEAESTGQGTPQGVVLALVGPEGEFKDQEGIRSLRMYNLSSLISLAKWSISQKGSPPLDLRNSTGGRNYHSLSKKHRPQSSLTKNLKHLISDAPIAQPQSPSQHISEQSSYSPVADVSASTSYIHSLGSGDSPQSLSGWDVVDDLPLRWATHYTPLASAGSRLINTSVLFYELYRHEGQRGRGGALLAVATKSNIFLYEAPKGERAFHLIKEFYTPLTARSITFVQQSVQETMTRSSSDISPRASGIQSHHPRHSRVISLGTSKMQRFPQLSLFVVFEKKAGLIRIADSAVGEVEMFDEGYGYLSSTAMPNSTLNRKTRASWDGRGFAKEHKAVWVPPVKINLPGPPNHPSMTHMYIVTRGKISHIVPYPLPSNLSSIPPYRSLGWSSAPTHVSCRVCLALSPDGNEPTHFLQTIAFGEDGVEVQEIPLSSLSQQKGKGRVEEPTRSQSDLGGQTGFLHVGGHWHRPYYQILRRSDSTQSEESFQSDMYDLSPDELVDKIQAEQGIYGWVQKGLEDWRVFWVGGTSAEREDAKDYYL